MRNSRRTFIQKILAVATVSPSVDAATYRLATANSITRQEAALRIRTEAAIFQSQQPVANHVSNGDEISLNSYIGNFAKGLPHTQLGEVEPSSYQSLLRALATGSQSELELLSRGSGAKLVNPMAAFGFQMEGADSNRLGMDPPPAFSGAEVAGEMVELYWQALMRDVPFADYAASPIASAATREMNRLSAFRGPGAGGNVSTETLFRSNVAGGLVGPYISQFFWQPVPLNSTVFQQLYRSGFPGIDYLTSFGEWLVVQTGVPPFREWMPDPQARYICNGRSLSEWVHYDFLYQAYHNTALILMNQTPDTVLNTNPYLNPTNPYKSTTVQSGFATFGAAHICCMLGAACEAALMAAWFQKWLVHRRMRPEEFGGRVHQTKAGFAKYPIHNDVLDSEALKAIFAATGTYLLPQAYPEGCPLHPSYPSGHATVAGACSTMLKAFFDENQILTNCVVASGDGMSIYPWTDTALTVGGEINKLAFNVAMGRNFAGIHWRSDAEAGIRLGEQVAIAMLQDYVNTFAEDFRGFQFTLMDRTPVSILRNSQT